MSRIRRLQAVRLRAEHSSDKTPPEAAVISPAAALSLHSEAVQKIRATKQFREQFFQRNHFHGAKRSSAGITSAEESLHILHRESERNFFASVVKSLP